MPVNTCIIGYGLSAKIFHIPHILSNPSLHLHSILQRTPTPGNNCTLDHPTVTLHHSLDTILADPQIHLAIICTPNSTHYPFACALLSAGKHVVVEKPFTATLAEAEELVALAKRAGKVLTVFQNRRWDSDFLTLRRLLQTGVFGRVVSLESHFDRFKPLTATQQSWKTEEGNGVLLDLGPHLVDQALVLFGLPTRVWGCLRNEREQGGAAVDDAFDAVLFYDDSNCIVKISASTTSLCERQLRFVVRGTEAGWVKYGLDVQEGQTKAGMGVEETGFGVEKEEAWGALTTVGGSERVRSERGCYTRFFENLVDALEGRGELEVKAEEVADVVKVLGLVGVSSREGRVVEVGKAAGRRGDGDCLGAR